LNFIVEKITFRAVDTVNNTVNDEKGKVLLVLDGNYKLKYVGISEKYLKKTELNSLDC
jgi:hypothetical protein